MTRVKGNFLEVVHPFKHCIGKQHSTTEINVLAMNSNNAICQKNILSVITDIPCEISVLLTKGIINSMYIFPSLSGCVTVPVDFNKTALLATQVCGGILFIPCP